MSHLEASDGPQVRSFEMPDATGKPLAENGQTDGIPKDALLIDLYQYVLLELQSPHPRIDATLRHFFPGPYDTRAYVKQLLRSCSGV